MSLLGDPSDEILLAQYTKERHDQHFGERHVQEQLGIAKSMPPWIVQPEMPQQHSDFYANLHYFSIATTDSKNRPWATILTSPKGFIKPLSSSILSISCIVASEDPFVRAIVEHEEGLGSSEGKKLLFAGLGVDFTNRRRNKVAGVILQSKVKKLSKGSSKLELTLFTNENMGNCPKYITVRTLQYAFQEPEKVEKREGTGKGKEGIELDKRSLDIISKASTIFFATRHFDNNTAYENESDIGLNHRGGNPGFVRVDKREKDTFVMLPDFSGNRFYQSLGNVQSDGVAGIVFPDFSTGDMLHITGEATNIFNEEANSLMPRTTLITQIRITSYTLLYNSLSLSMNSPEKLSPYNPPLRYLKWELEKMGRGAYAGGGSGEKKVASLVVIREVGSMVKEFTFRVKGNLENVRPGGYAIFDFKGAVNLPYMHMNPGQPQLVNDDLVRTWTISSSSSSSESTEISCMIKLNPSGLISPFLHSLKKVQLELGLIGVGGDFSCFPSEPNVVLPKKMVWVSGGIGITPFLSMYRAISSLPGAETDIFLYYSCRDDDLHLFFELLKDPNSVTSKVRLHGKVFHTQSPAFLSSLSFSPLELQKKLEEGKNWSFEKRRVMKEDLAGLNDFKKREVYVCGPGGLEERVVGWVEEIGVKGKQVHRENFSF
uniref:Oxidoreductase FAD/NAD(P)-binding domain-containing protein n=1 Tax=Paramoeba aestuarina TaxID=180227 RepID=A0A7S4P8V7_9EUKA|mmetsp:Transcript_38389/g.60816  ORF Transcript_38389/g.60816 Transcript_38389/m.60816 type:complete len:658 (+) Transcript_38389:633-2606(+)